MNRLFPLFALALVSPAYAQLDPDCRFAILQDGVEQGQIFVPPDQGTCRYDEYWFVYGGFDFVSVRSRAGFDVKVTGKADSLERFLDEMWSAHPDGRLLVSHVTESREGCR